MTKLLWLLALNFLVWAEKRQIFPGSGHSCDVICDEEVHGEPVCGSDGKLYKTPCDFNNANCLAANGGDRLVVVSSGACVDLETPCQVALQARCNPHQLAILTGVKDGFEYVCGSNNVTFGSACEFRTTQCMYQQMPSTTQQLTFSHYGECVLDTSTSYMVNCSTYVHSESSGLAIEGGTNMIPNQIACPKNFDPICIPDGRTIPNDCMYCSFLLLTRQLGENMIAYALHKGPCTSNQIGLFG